MIEIDRAMLQSMASSFRGALEFSFNRHDMAELMDRCAIRTDLSQAAVAAALEVAAKEHDAEIVRLEAQIIENKNYLRLVGKSERSSANDFCNTAIGHHRGSAVRLRDLITPAQHDALAAHVAAEVAKARAEDVVRIEALEAAAKAGAELAAYASYSEIVGAIGHNRPQIREWCDKVFAAGHALQDLEWKALTAAHEAAQIGAKP